MNAVPAEKKHPHHAARPANVVYAQVKSTALDLLAYCQQNDWAGYDPYDALNSELFQRLPILDYKLPRIAFIQVLKRLPLNLRGFLKIPKTQNPKALALFIKALIKLHQMGFLQEDSLIAAIAARIEDLRSPEHFDWCWGYSFPWQTRDLLVPRGAPNLICTLFVADALLDLHAWRADNRYRDMAISTAKYIIEKLYWSRGDSQVGFSYPTPHFYSHVHNANLLAAGLLCRVYDLTGDRYFLRPALHVANYSASKQNRDGSWKYGEGSNQGWIDNFHTGYNLLGLDAIIRYAGQEQFKTTLHNGLQFYINNFFHDYNKPKYFDTQLYPIDIHCIAQSIITLVHFADCKLVKNDQLIAIFDWSLENFYDKDGYFYYQVTPLYKNKIPYMRWSQAWMLYSLTLLLDYLRNRLH